MGIRALAFIVLAALLLTIGLYSTGGIIDAGANEPPGNVDILRPKDGAVVMEGSPVTFQVDVFDPDMASGQTLTVVWTSNISGQLRTITTMSELKFTTDDLDRGVHNITVTASDGEFQKESWVTITVVEFEPISIRTYRLEPTDVSPIATMGLMVLVLLFSTAVVTRGHMRMLDRFVKEFPEPPPPEPGPLEQATSTPRPLTHPSVLDGPPKQVDQPGLQALSMALGSVIDKLEHEKAEDSLRATSQRPAEQHAPQTQPLDPPLPVEVLVDRERTREVREVMMVLTQLPGGIPTTLWGWEIGALASAIVDGQRVIGPEGQPYVLVDNHWYNANTRDLGKFLGPWVEPKPSPVTARPNRSREHTLDMLEARLLEGKISEETYNRLRLKYEGG